MPFCECYGKVNNLALIKKIGGIDMKNSNKRIKGKICALAVLGMFVALMLVPTVVAPDGEELVYSDGNYRIDIDNNANEIDRQFIVSHNAGTELFRVQEDGNVGIGVTTATEKLTIDGNFMIAATADRSIYIASTDAPGDGYDLTVRAGHGTAMASNNDGGDLRLTGGNGDGGVSGNGGDVLIYGGVNGGGSDGDVILAFTDNNIRGNVGIATMSPSYLLTVRSQVSGADTIAAILADDDGPVMKINKDASDDAYLGLYDGSANNDIKLSTDGDSWFNGGDVGIGQTSPSHKLEISDTDTSSNRAGLYVSQSGANSGNGYGLYGMG